VEIREILRRVFEMQSSNWTKKNFHGKRKNFVIFVPLKKFLTVTI